MSDLGSLDGFGSERMEAIEMRIKVGLAIDDLIGHYVVTRATFPEMGAVPFAADHSLVCYLQDRSPMELSLLLVAFLEDMYERMDVSEREQWAAEHECSDEKEGEEDHG